MSVIQTREIAPHVVRVGPGRVPGRTAAPEAQRPEAGLTGRDVFRILRKRKWLIIVSLAACVAVAIAATVLWLMYAPLYTAEAYLEVRPEPLTFVTPERTYMTPDLMEIISSKYANLTGSDGVLESALGSQSVRATQWLQSSPENALLRLKNKLNITVTNSAMIRISATGTNKKELPELVNAVATAARERSAQQASQTKLEQITQFNKARTTLADQRDRIRTQKAQLLREADVPDLTARTNVKELELQQLAPQISTLELELAQADSQLQLVRQQVDRGEAQQMPTVLQALEMDPSLRALTSALLNYKARLPAVEAKYDRNHPKYKEFIANIDSMAAEAEIKRTDLVKVTVQSIVANTEANKAIILDRLVKLRDKYRLTEVTVRQHRATLSAFTQLDESEKTLTEQIDRIDGRLTDLRLIQTATTPLEILQLASEPLEPSMPKWTIMIPLGVLLGLVVGLGMSFLLEFIDTSIKGPSDVLRRIDLPMLGMVPHADDIEEEIEDFRKAFATHPNSLVSEAFRQVRTCLQFSGPASQRRTLLVTSPQPEDGRTTVAMNLAASIARSGRKVLVVDANFRQPSLRDLCPDCPEGGLSSALVGQGAWREMTLEIEPNFSVMASGPMPPNPGELLGSEQMRTILAEMVTEYDQVIFDGAPCLVVTDSVALGSLVDGIVMVVRAGANTYGIVQRTQEVLAKGGTHVLGIVLNGVRAVAGGYLRKNYEAFYDYHEQTKLIEK